MTQADGRYSRQSVLPVIGADGQRRIRAASALVAGCGGLGTHIAETLARAGIGRLVLVDRDIVELHNLPRQALFDEADVAGRAPKALAAARHLARIASDVVLQPEVAVISAANVEALVARVDVVLDGTDNFETRYLLNDACVKAGKPWIHGGVLATDGNVLAVVPGVGPCLRCVFPDAPPPGSLPTCATAGVLSTAVAWVAALEATEALKILVGAPFVPGRLHSFDVWNGEYTRVDIRRSPDCPCCGRRDFEFLDGRYVGV